MKMSIFLFFILLLTSINIVNSTNLKIKIDEGFDMQNARYLSITKPSHPYELGDVKDTLLFIPITSNTFRIDFDLPDTLAEYQINFAPIDYGEYFFIKNSDTIHYFLNYNKEFYISLSKEYGFADKLIKACDSLNNHKLTNYIYNSTEVKDIIAVNTEITIMDHYFIENISKNLISVQDSAALLHYINNRIKSTNYSILINTFLKQYRQNSIKISSDDPFQEVCSYLNLYYDFISSDIRSARYIRDFYFILKTFYKRTIDSNYTNSLADDKNIINKLVPVKVRLQFYKQLLLSYLINSESDNNLLQNLMDFMNDNKSEIPKNTYDYFKSEISIKTTLKTGGKFPSVKVQTLEEQYINLKNEFKRPTIIYIWATWCTHCLEVFKSLSQIKRILDKHNIDLILLSTDPGFNRWSRYVSSHLNEYKNYISFGGSESPIGRLFGINSIPFYLLVDADGTILDVNTISFSDENYELLIKEMLKSK